MKAEHKAIIDTQSILDGNRRSLAKSITLIESQLPEHQEMAQQLLEAVLPHSGNSIRIGISGSPGVGKSTFIETFGRYLLKQGKKLAVLAVDPSSPIAGGSILGDKTRMEQLSREPNAYIRPSPSSGVLGGVAQKTRETTLLCEAAGFDVILIETVGVGQSEYQVAGMVDFFLVLMQPSAGDELQGIKKGIVELADAIVINKADGDLENFANQARGFYQNALNLIVSSHFWQPKVLTCSALRKHNIDSIWSMVMDYDRQARSNKIFEKKRRQQTLQWMDHLFQQLVNRHISGHKHYLSLKKELEIQVLEQKITPITAVEELFRATLIK
ncbi:MAG: LAO/AO transport system kinase [Cellvibrionaceae bacterium]|jgi:LAO/AO transport system kinase